MKVAIMQPTYLPWSGYFGLLNSVDLFIFLDSVQFERRSWQQRNQIKITNGSQWLTVPVNSKGKREQKINEVEIDLNSRYYEKHQKSIILNYNKSLFFSNTSKAIFEVFEKNINNLSCLNIELIKVLNNLLGIKTKTLMSSDLISSGVKSELLASICSEVGAKEYISPPGSKSYLEQSDAFDEIETKVNYFKFNHPRYSQNFDGFLENMSVIDLLMNCGEESIKLIENSSEIIQ
jgi:hypothetical protein